VAVLQDRVQCDAVMLLRQILTGNPDQHAMVKQRAKDAVMVLPSRQAAGGHAGDRFVRRAGAAGKLQRVPSHKAAREVGLVCSTSRSAARGRRPARPPHTKDQRPGVQHQVLADQARGIGQANRKMGRGRIQQQPRRADAVPVKVALTTCGVALPSVIYMIANAVVSETCRLLSAVLCAPPAPLSVSRPDSWPLISWAVSSRRRQRPSTDLIPLIGGGLGMALMRPERETTRWANVMPETAVGVA
jgi:hypothetical protein